MQLLLALGLGYLLGSIPFGLILTRLAGGGDIRSIGSGNIGATNVLRTGRKGVAAATLVLDAAKGAVAVLLGGGLAGDLGALAAGLGAFSGHVHPLWLGFRGGKGVATLLGVATALGWGAGLAFALAWGLMAAWSRISSVGGMTAGFAAAGALLLAGRQTQALLVFGLALWVLWTHRANISRIMAGTEPRIGER